MRAVARSEVTKTFNENLLRLGWPSSLELNKLCKSGVISCREDGYCWEVERPCETASRPDCNYHQFSDRRWGNYNSLISRLQSVRHLLCQDVPPGGLAVTWASSTTTSRLTPPDPCLGLTSWSSLAKLSSASRGKHLISPAPSRIWAIWR